MEVPPGVQDRSYPVVFAARVASRFSRAALRAVSQVALPAALPKAEEAYRLCPVGLVAWPVEDMATELNVESPVGRALCYALPGETLTVAVPMGDVVVNVLEIC